VKGCEIIIEVCHRASELVNDMIRLPKDGEIRLREININDEVENCTSLLAIILPRQIRLERDCCESLPGISAKASQIHQILINLVNNASEAMNHQGRIRIETAKTLVAASDCRLHPDARPGEFVILRVSDTGPGISSHVISRIFDPFFSTKEGGDNAGLGLTTVQRIMREHEGWIDVKSREGQGTSFRLFFPSVTPGGDKKEEKQ
jgi:two-component system, cell cycle sensor histidine kinase and response regulator CckA